jgi:hypothetical protein
MPRWSRPAAATRHTGRTRGAPSILLLRLERVRSPDDRRRHRCGPRVTPGAIDLVVGEWNEPSRWLVPGDRSVETMNAGWPSAARPACRPPHGQAA